MNYETRTSLNSLRCDCDSKTVGAPTLHGYAATFNRSYDMGKFDEVIAPTAFSRSLRESPDIMALFNHDPAMPVARTTNGSLKLSEDSRGLSVLIEPISTTYADDMMEAVRTGVITAMSFGFNVRADKFERRENGKVTRIIEDVDLHEVSIVTFPANPSTSIEIDTRSFEKWKSRGRKFYLLPPS